MTDDSFELHSGSVPLCNFYRKYLEDGEIITIFADKYIMAMSEDFKNPENKSCTANESSLAEIPLSELKEVDYTFGNRDFGYPHTLEELDAVLDEADAQRNDPAKWISSIEFHTRLESKYPWLR